MALSLEYTIVNAFTSKAFRGNPAAVIVLDDGDNIDDSTLQLIAEEFRLSETAFVKRRESDGIVGHACFALRWFTPTAEIALCGHATIATAYVLSRVRNMIDDSVKFIKFDTLSGVLTAEVLPDGRFRLELPAGEATEVEGALESSVMKAIHAALGEHAPKVHFVGTGSGISFNKYVLIEIDESFDLSSTVVNAKPFLDLAPEKCVFILTSTTKKPGITFISRAFGPAFGVDEDPVCGSAHCMLGPYWQQRLNLSDGTPMSAQQVSRRGGFIEVICYREKGTCNLIGNAFISMNGELFL